ncbi:MAG: DUF429 domain-containing protein [Caldimicrobium sp.]|nr:DUF429 domain-containing protein [Caldimicrobium sp.]MCX7873819.1 DUF429 domain-containing protein [Caldimicrobium sp.]MDW8094311.1 DUF429 domain-containing protein [Caldimicrobium sp.]
MFYFLGIDLGGSKNTWVVALKENPYERERLYLCEAPLKNNYPGKIPLEEILKFAKENRVLTVAIDAPLSFSLNLEKGWRKSDLTLRSLLPQEGKNWVLSYHALMGIPIRGYLLAQSLCPYVGTILESHPRANLYMILPENRKYLAHKYKKGGLLPEERSFLMSYVTDLFKIELTEEVIDNSGLLDALLCALVGFYYCRYPEKLTFLPPEEEAIGFGPFVIFKEIL